MLWLVLFVACRPLDGALRRPGLLADYEGNVVLPPKRWTRLQTLATAVPNPAEWSLRRSSGSRDVGRTVFTCGQVLVARGEGGTCEI